MSYYFLGNTNWIINSHGDWQLYAANLELATLMTVLI